MGDPLREGKKGTSTKDPSKEDRERGEKKLPEGTKQDKSAEDIVRAAVRDKGRDQSLAKGGRAMYKSGMRVCKLAKRGRGRAYGKNS